MTIKQIGSETLFQGKIFNVRVDTLRTESGHTSRIELVEHAGAAVIIPQDPEAHIWLVRQYRHPAGERLLELPAGTLEAGESPLVCAERECQEEIGMRPGELHPLGSSYLAPGYSTELVHFFLARELTHAPLPGDEDEDLRAERFSWESLQQCIREGTIRDAKTLAGLLLAQLHGAFD
jgi:ADP-ribose pyrophosphatase